MAIGDVYVITDEGYVNPSDEIVNVFHVRDTDGAGSETDLLTQWEAHGWFEQLRAYLSTDFIFDVVTTRKLIPYGTASIFLPHTTHTSGASVNAVMALNSAAVTSWYTGFLGRSRRGRTFTSGFPSIDEVKGLWSGSGYTAFNTVVTAFFNYWKTGGTSGHYELGVWSRTLAGPTPPFSATAFEPVTIFTNRTWFRSQRRRNYGVSISRSS